MPSVPAGCVGRAWNDCVMRRSATRRRCADRTFRNHAPDRAERLAADVGGTVLETTERPIVVVESRESIARELAGLAALPEPVDHARPFVLFDTETTGLGTGTGTVPFLVGVGRWEHGDFVTRQLLLPEQSDEAGYLDALETLIPPDAVLVSYNGRTFDWPLLVTRYRLHGRKPPAYGAHLDLLPLARSFWKHRLPDARLASVEAGICGVRRDHDLAGGLVPGRYLDYLRHGRGTLLRDVLEHNRQDVVSMALLLRVLALDLAPVATNGTLAGGGPSRRSRRAGPGLRSQEATPGGPGLLRRSHGATAGAVGDTALRVDRHGPRADAHAHGTARRG